MCGCAGARAARTVWYVLWPDGSRTADFDREADARAANVRAGGRGTVIAEKAPA